MKKVYLVAVVFALIAGFATFMFAREIQQNATLSDAEKIDVVVAIGDVDEKTAVTTENVQTMFKVQPMVKSYTIDKCYSSLDQIVGKTLREKIYKGEQVTENKMVSPDDADASLSLTLPDGYKAYSINAAGVQSVDGYIEKGDTVNVLVNSGNSSSVAMKNLEVWRVSSHTQNVQSETGATTITEYSTLTFIVTEEQANKLYNIERSGGFKLLLNPKIENGKSNNIVLSGISSTDSSKNVPANNDSKNSDSTD